MVLAPGGVKRKDVQPGQKAEPGPPQPRVLSSVRAEGACRQRRPPRLPGSPPRRFRRPPSPSTPLPARASAPSPADPASAAALPAQPAGQHPGGKRAGQKASLLNSQGLGHWGTNAAGSPLCAVLCEQQKSARPHTTAARYRRAKTIEGISHGLASPRPLYARRRLGGADRKQHRARRWARPLG